MVVCKFFQKGDCWYGDNCKFEHPRNVPAFGGGNRFGALQPGGGGGAIGGRSDATRREPERENKYKITKADIENDLTSGKNRPMWIFSCYAPSRDVPVHLFGGPQREQSFEEMRVAHYAAVASGTPDKAVQEANNMYIEAEQQMKTILGDLDGAVRYVINGEFDHPNRFDIIEGKPALEVETGPFGQPQQAVQQAAQPSPFGQPAAPNNAPGFGQPASGQPTNFGQPTPIGGNQPGGNQPGFGQPGFPQTQQGGGGFGQPTQSPFAQATTQNQPGGFGQFSEPSKPTSGFGQPTSNASPFGQGNSAASPFAQPAAAAPAANPFGAPAPKPSAPFGQPAPFSTPTAPAAPAPSAQPTPTPVEIAKTGFSRIIEKNLSGLPNLTGQTVRDPATKKLRSWKGQPVTYVSDDNPCYSHPQDPAILVHIFFPDAPPSSAVLKDAQAKDEEYTPEIEAAYKFAKQHGQFRDGVIPKVPPKNEWCSFEF